jgi:hypothetical protein
LSALLLPKFLKLNEERGEQRKYFEWGVLPSEKYFTDAQRSYSLILGILVDVQRSLQERTPY